MQYNVTEKMELKQKMKANPKFNERSKKVLEQSKTLSDLKKIHERIDTIRDDKNLKI